jgi:hypothetical protein
VRAESEAHDAPFFRISLESMFVKNALSAISLCADLPQTWDASSFLPAMIKIKDANLPELVLRVENIILIAPVPQLKDNPVYNAPISYFLLELISLVEQLKRPNARPAMFCYRAPVIVARSEVFSLHFPADNTAAFLIEQASATINQFNKGATRHELWSPQSLAAVEREIAKFLLALTIG